MSKFSKKKVCQKKSKKYDTFLPLFFSHKKASLFSFFLKSGGGGVVIMGLRSPLRANAADDDVGLIMDAKRASSCCGRGKRAFSTSAGIRAGIANAIEVARAGVDLGTTTLRK